MKSITRHARITSSRAPAAIVPGQEPARDAGVSRFAENGSHLEAADAAESHAGQVDRPGSSGNARIGSHPEGADTAESHAGLVDGPGGSGNAGRGSHLAATEVSARWRKRHKKHRDSYRGHGANPKGQKGQSPRGEATSRYVLTSGRCRLPRWPRRCRCAWQERISQRRAPRCRRR